VLVRHTTGRSKLPNLHRFVTLAFLFYKEADLIRKKRVLIVCGTAIATSTMVAYKVEEFLKKKGIPAEIRRAMTSESKTASKDVDLIISTTQVPGVDVPVLSGIPYITGVGVANLEQEILNILNKPSEQS
jgi:PTS system galactitol-specific IIB component